MVLTCYAVVLTEMSSVRFGLRIRTTAAWALLFVCVLAGTAGADGWQWPAQLTLAGFTVTGVSGSVRPDGSGTASGALRIPRLGSPMILLTRSAAGEISGTLNISAKPAGVEFQGGFVLENAGLKGRGTVRTSPRQVVDASISINPNGQASGTGVVQLGGLNVPAKISFSENSCNISGSAPTRAEADTPLAAYEFNGNLDLGLSGTKITVTARGVVRRTGKLANQLSTQDVSNVSVDPSDGQGKVNVGGVSVVFDFFGN